MDGLNVETFRAGAGAGRRRSASGPAAITDGKVKMEPIPIDSDSEAPRRRKSSSSKTVEDRLARAVTVRLQAEPKKEKKRRSRSRSRGRRSRRSRKKRRRSDSRSDSARSQSSRSESSSVSLVPPLKRKAQKDPGSVFKLLEQQAGGAAGSRWSDGRRVHDRFPGQTVHLLPAGSKAGLGSEVARLPRDQPLSKVPGYAKGRPIGQFGRHLGRKVTGRGNSHQTGVGHSKTSRSLWPRRGGPSAASHTPVGTAAPATSREGWRKRKLAKDDPVELVGLADRCSAEGQGQRRQRKRQAWQRERQRKRQRRRSRGDRSEAKGGRSLAPKVEVSNPSSGGDAAFEVPQPPAAESALVTAPERPGGLDMGAAGSLPVAGPPGAGLVGRAPYTVWVGRLKRCKNLSEIGIALAWGLTRGFVPALSGGARPRQLPGARKRISGLFPLPVEVPSLLFERDDLPFLGRGDPSFSKLAVTSWRAVSCAALNAYYGCSFTLTGVRAGKIHSAVRDNLERRIERFLKQDADFVCSFDGVKRDLKEKKVSYTGEEVSQPLPLSVSQIIGGLPPRGHGASVPVEPFVVGRTKYLLEHPLETLKEVSERVASPCKAKVHIKAGEELSVFQLLEERGVVEWVPESVAFSDERGTYLNGLFGVVKQGRFTETGEPVLRVIMNLIPVNSILEIIKGDITYLPSPTAWISICADDGECFSMSQGDMQSAFYLFKMPRGWEQFFCFNFVTRGENVGQAKGTYFRPACRVLPMGWSSSVGIMQQISRQVLLSRGLPSALEVQRVQGVPRWFTQTVAESSTDRAWWQVYLDNFMSGESSRTVTPMLGRFFQEEAMRAWSDAGILTAEDKQVLDVPSVVELGIRFDGVEKLLGASPERLAVQDNPGYVVGAGG